MRSTKNIKILLFVAIILVFVLFVTALGYFRKPQWVASYSESNYAVFEKYLYSFGAENSRKGVLWFQSVENFEGVVKFKVLDESTFTELALPVSLREDTGYLFEDLNDKKAPYSIFMSVSFDYQSKNFVDEMFCSYLKGDFCNRSTTLKNWRVYKNTFPYPEITAEESYTLYGNMLNYHNDKIKNTEQNPELVTITKYIFSSKIDKNTFPESQEYDLFTNTAMDNKTKARLLYLINPNHSYYQSLKESLCTNSGYDYFYTTFRESELVFIEKICKKEIKPSTFSESESTESLLLSELRSFNYELKSDFAYNEILTNGVFNGLNNPYCNSGSKDSLCSEYILNLYKILLVTVQKHEKSL